MPQDDDERFIVGLVLTYYRRHPQRARTRLLDLLGEVLSPAPPGATADRASAGKPGARADDGTDLWARTAGRCGAAETQALIPRTRDLAKDNQSFIICASRASEPLPQRHPPIHPCPAPR